MTIIDRLISPRGALPRPILLSHCYADPEMPLLREVGVFAVRRVPSPESRVSWFLVYRVQEGFGFGVG